MVAMRITLGRMLGVAWRSCWAACLAGVVVSSAEARGVAEHVVVVVMDGLRPDFITPQYAPNAYALATNGVFFRRNHPAFISTTIVNGAALATGTHPGRSGILANSDYREELSILSPVASEVLDTIRRADRFTGGKYVAVDTLAELIQDAGHHTYIAGTKSVTLLHDRKPRRTDTAAHSNSVVLGRGLVMPRRTGDALQKVNDDKVFPDNFTTPNVASDSWTTRALTRGLWKNGVPKYSLLWLSDPDVTQHAKGVGAPESLTALENSDRHLGDLISVLKSKGVYEKTDLFVVSDHGFSDILRGADVAEALRKGKLNAHTKLDNPETGDVLVVPLGGAALVYVVDRSEEVVRRAVEILQGCDFTGVLFSRVPLEGTFPLSAVKYPADQHQPDLIVSMRWDDQRGEHGWPGRMIATGGSKGQATHGSLSRSDMNNTLLAAGPDFRRGVVSQVPSGNVDVAPTILHLLGIRPREPMDGRVLWEGLKEGEGREPKVSERRMEASRSLGFLHWTQYLLVHEVDGTMYFTEGNGRLETR